MRNQRVTAVLVAGMLYWSALIPAYCARFVDLSGDAVEKAVNALSDKGVIAAEPDGKFKGNEPITRAILAQWMVKTLALENQPVSSTPSFPDVKPSDPNYKYVEIIRQNNYISGFADGFRPNGFIQKGEVIAIIARALPTSPPSEGKIADILAGFTDGSKIPSWAKAGIAQA
ncbi:MAG TPA: S-layer homology domain-containing protein, partial [Candidatus Obscuribacterales bacterium]